jgi:AraC-like DNA-binding protein
VRLSAQLSDRDGSLLEGLAADQTRHGVGVTITYPHACLALPLGVRRYQSWAACETAAFLKIAVRARAVRDTAVNPLVQALRELLAAEPIPQVVAARRLGMSVPTLHRRLTRAGTSFREISRDVRSRKLRGLLATDASLDDIAVELGLSDRRSLWRASFEWLGMSPAAYRRQWRETVDGSL